MGFFAQLQAANCNNRYEAQDREYLQAAAPGVIQRLEVAVGRHTMHPTAHTYKAYKLAIQDRLELAAAFEKLADAALWAAKMNHNIASVHLHAAYAERDAFLALPVIKP